MILEDLRAEDLATPQEKRWALLLGAGTWPEVRRCLFTSGVGWWLVRLRSRSNRASSLARGPAIHTLGERGGLPCLQVLRRLVLTRAQDEDNPDQ